MGAWAAGTVRLRGRAKSTPGGPMVSAVVQPRQPGGGSECRRLSERQGVGPQAFGSMIAIIALLLALGTGCTAPVGSPAPVPTPAEEPPPIATPTQDPTSAPSPSPSESPSTGAPTKGPTDLSAFVERCVEATKQLDEAEFRYDESPVMSLGRAEDYRAVLQPEGATGGPGAGLPKFRQRLPSPAPYQRDFGLPTLTWLLLAGKSTSTSHRTLLSGIG